MRETIDLLHSFSLFLPLLVLRFFPPLTFDSPSCAYKTLLCPPGQQLQYKQVKKMPGKTPKCKSLSLLARYFNFYFIAYTVTKSSINTKLMKEVQQGRSCTFRKFLCLFSEEQLETFEYVPMYNLNYVVHLSST